MPETLQSSSVVELKAPTPGSAKNDTLFWNALAGDSGAGVLVYDARGRVTLGNAAAAALCNAGSPADLTSKSLHDLMRAEIAEEHLAHARRVVETGEPVAIDGMVNGRMTRTTLRAIPGESAQEDRVLATVQPIAAETPKPEGVHHVKAKTNDEGPIAKLTTREREVLYHIGRGLSTAEIASTLGRSTKTVEWHRVSLGNKLGITNRVELARIAIRAGVTGVEA